jgi:hypothetical protein
MKAFLLNTLKITDEVKSELDNIISMFRRWLYEERRFSNAREWIILFW